MLNAVYNRKSREINNLIKIDSMKISIENIYTMDRYILILVEGPNQHKAYLMDQSCKFMSPDNV